MLLTLLGTGRAEAQAVQTEPKGQEAEDPALVAEEQKILSDNIAAAEAWLKLIDSGNYAESWETASTTFKLTIGKDEWVKAEEKLRKPLGALVSRKLLEQLPKQNPKGLPAGYYMVLVYQTDFTNRPKANELLTMALESDGKWRTLTYQAR